MADEHDLVTITTMNDHIVTIEVDGGVNALVTQMRQAGLAVYPEHDADGFIALSPRLELLRLRPFHRYTPPVGQRH